ncbi:hypothetical protein [Cellulomonas shaoxiangyii]|uniref:Uncharacterized protein n=1 Tax=Cellulomonas shaoxiangyii TaxID=2566013 RepID=A0A4P7SEU6_9CELL|nr:hypothetical protein [Cellulomonas shaoxiangyii]QCB92669.1 hypothetical protein E5225_02995 [Cellulomonas shaoxiangyii]TGY83434.1 hypothetical protein E5226_12155 [Cellulomonas shaoxiangyii]
MTAGTGLPADAPTPEARIRAALGEIQRLGAELETRRAQEGDARAEAARKGALGADWQAVQRRVDAGRTSLDAVFGGQDDSPEAVALRAGSRARLQALAAEPRDQLPETTAEALDALDALRRRWSGGVGRP